ncbi:MAG: hypothetical protein Q8N28_01880 [bacterium]|nr:hypothetical protein [bacterium]
MNKELKNLIFFITALFFAVIIPNSLFIIHTANAATNISATTAEHYAWNDTIGWIDFYSTGNVNVLSAQLNGYATSSVGFIALDCATSPNGNICATSNFKVSNDGSGNFTGWAYNDAIGWISFDSGTATSSYPYQVTINNSTGDFSGWAWNDIVGWISFNCLQPDICATSNYKVKTSWTTTPETATLTSSIFDTGVSTGVAINTIMWQGSQPTGTGVKFQIASDATSTPATWNYRGPDGSDTTHYQPTGDNVQSQINLAYHNNHRYFRYKIFLTSNSGQTLSPRVDDVIINWSP